MNAGYIASIGKTRTIKAENKVPLSIITSHAYLCIDKEDLVQENGEFKPESWLYKEYGNEELAKNDTAYVKYAELFRETRNDFLADRIRSVENEHMEENEDIIDELIRLCKETKETKLCSECGALNEAKLSMCSNCRGPLMKQSFTRQFVINNSHRSM